MSDKGQKITPVGKFFGRPSDLLAREAEQARTSASTKRRIRAEAMIRRGLHPFGFPLLEPRGETCGSCRLSRHRGVVGKGWYKCDLMGGGGPATDLRVSWPACSKWKADGKEADDGKENG